PRLPGPGRGCSRAPVAVPPPAARAAGSPEDWDTAGVHARVKRRAVAATPHGFTPVTRPCLPEFASRRRTAATATPGPCADQATGSRTTTGISREVFFWYSS